MNTLDPSARLPEASGAQVQPGGVAPRTRIHPAVVVIIYWVIFLVLQRAAALLAPTPAVSVWYFPAALSLALLLILGPAYAPALLVAPFLGNLLLVLRPGGIPLADAVTNAVAHALGYGLVVLAFTQARLSPRLRQVSDAGGFILAAVVAPLLVAIPAVVSLQWGGALSPLHPIPAFRAFWMGDTLGVLTLAPFLLVWILPVVRGELTLRWAPWRPERPLEAILQSAALVLGALLTVRMSSPGTLHLKYVLFLPLLWVALRGGLKAVSLAIPFLSLTLLALLLWNGRPPSILLDAQAFLVILFGTTLLMGSAVDAQDRALRAWQRAEEDRSRFFQMTRELLAIWDAEGRFQDLNPAWEVQYGHRRKDMLGTPLLDLVHPEDRQEVLAGHQRLFRGEDPVTFESRFRSRDGSYRWLLWSATPLRDQGLAYGVARDITDRKEMELRLRASEAQYRSTLASLEEGVVLWDLEGRVVASNAAAEWILGSEPWLLDGSLNEAQDVIHEDGTPLHVDELPSLRALRTGIPVPGTVIGFLRTDGSRAWIRVAAQPLVSEGVTQGVVCSLADVTQQRTAVEDLLHSERELRSILDTLPDMIFQMDARGTYLGFRSPGQESPFLPPEAFLGRTVRQVLPELADAAMEAIHRCLEEGRPQSFGYQLPGPTGPRHYEARIIPHRADEVLAIVRDISDLKQHEEAIRVALREKEVLLKEIHHRVKNNLQVVSSLLRLQANSHRDPAVQAALQEAQERIHAIALIHQKLKHAPDPTRLDLAAYIQTLAERLVRSYASTPTLVDLQIQVDPVRLGPDEAVPLGLILNELVSNILQHAFPPGEGGSIEIQVEALPGGQALLRIADSGVGLPEGVDLDRGGLGFQLVRALADQLGGTLELERRRGAAFRLTFTPHPGPNLHDL